MKESGVVCKKKKVYLLSLLLFLISYLTTVVNMIVNIITGSFHLYIFSTLSFMLPCYKSIKTTDVFGIVLTILLFLISFLLIFFTVKYDVLKYDQSKRPLCYTSLLLWFFITQILSSWILVDSHFQNYIYLSVAEFYESEELQYMNSIIIFGIYQLIIGLKRLYDSREAYDATNISIVPPFEKYFTEKTIFCYTVPNYIFSCIGVLSIIYIRYVFIDSYAISFWIFIFCVLFSLCLLLATLIKYRQIVKYRGVEIIVRKNLKISIFLQLKLVFLIFCTYCITLLFAWFLILGRTFAERRLERASLEYKQNLKHNGVNKMIPSYKSKKPSVYQKIEYNQ